MLPPLILPFLFHPNQTAQPLPRHHVVVAEQPVPKHKQVPVKHTEVIRHPKTHKHVKVTIPLPTGPMQNQHSIYHGLRNMGLSHNAAAGVEGNLYQESHGDSHAYNPVGGGLFGLTNENGGSPNGGSVSHELRHLSVYISQNGSVSDINAHAGSAREAASYFCGTYERPGDPQVQNREQAAQHFAQEESK